MKTVNSQLIGKETQEEAMKQTSHFPTKDHFKTNRELVIPKIRRGSNLGLLSSSEQKKISNFSQHQLYSQKETDDISIGGASAVSQIGPMFDQTFYSRKRSVQDNNESNLVRIQSMENGNHFIRDIYKTKLLDSNDQGVRMRHDSMQEIMFRNHQSTISVGVASYSGGEESNAVTTEDMLRAAINKTKTRHDKTNNYLTKFTTYESQEQKFKTPVDHQPAGAVQKRMHLTTNLAKLCHATAKKTSSGSIFADYTQSQTTLPQVSDHSISFDIASTSKGNLSQRKQSQVEMSKLDMQSFIQNGTLTKSFIKSNKKELESFIKSQARQGGSSDMFKGFQEITGLSKEQAQLLGVNSQEETKSYTKRSHSFAGNDQEEQKLIENKLQRKSSVNVYATDQKPEKGFRTEASSVSNRVIEMWLNETLTDAEHLDIPHVLLKPENKKPIQRYGIERFSLQKAGLSHDQIDRIYRSLFVYTVGFFELLKNLLDGTNKNYEVITSLWKVFHVLLEYCCKTDYKIMISEISRSYEQEKNAMEESFKQKVEAYVENERVLKQNMDTMQSFQDKLEKEKANERQLRLKLEEEYMQNAKNHEEEVQLRLKFEQKLNDMHADKRKLQIMYERTFIELEDAMQESIKYEKQCREQSAELVHLRQKEINQTQKIVLMQESIDHLQRDIEKKNNMIVINTAALSQTREDSDLRHYELQDAIKNMNESDSTARNLQKKNFELNQVLIDRQSQNEKLQQELENRISDFKKWQVTFNELQRDLLLSKEAEIKHHEQVKGQKELIKYLRNETESQNQEINRLTKLEEGHVIDIKSLASSLKRANADLDQNMSRLHLVNKERHYYKTRYIEMRDKKRTLKNELDQTKKALKAAEDTINMLYRNISGLTAEIEKLKEHNRKDQRALIDKMTKVEKQNFQLAERNKELQKKNQNSGDIIDQQKAQIAVLEDQVLQAHMERRKAEQKQHEAQKYAEKCKDDMIEQKTLADKFKVQAHESAIEAEEARQITMKFESTVRMYGEQMKQEQRRNEKKLQNLEKHQLFLDTCSQMEIEDYRSKFVDLSAENKTARYQMKKIANMQDTLDELQSLQNQVKYLQSKITEWEDLYSKSAEKNYKETQHLKEQHEIDLEEERKRHRLEINDLEQNASFVGKDQAAASARMSSEVSDLRKQVYHLEFELRKHGIKRTKTKQGSMTDVNEWFIDKSTQTKSFKPTTPLKATPMVDKNRSKTPDVPPSKQKISDDQLKPLKDWKDKINSWTEQMKKQAKMQQLLFQKYIQHLDALRAQNVFIPPDYRRTQLNVMKATISDFDDISIKTLSSEFKKSLQSIDKTPDKSSKMVNFVNGSDVSPSFLSGESRDEIIRKARQAALNQGLDEAEIERFVEMMVAGQDSDEYDSEEEVEYQGNPNMSSVESDSKSKRTKKSYGKTKANKTDRFADPNKTAEEIENDRFDAFKQWLLEQEMSIMNDITNQHEDHETIDAAASFSLYKKMREEILQKVPYEFKLLHMTDEQKNEIAQDSRQQAEDFMYQIELENEEILEQLREESYPDTERPNTLRTQRRKTRLIVNFKNIVENQNKEYLNLLDDMLKKKRDHQAQRARQKQKPHYVEEKIQHIRGKRANVFLIPMAIELSYTLYHQKLLKEGMAEAAREFTQRPGILKKLAEERQKLEEQNHKLWLEERKVKLARIEIVREDLIKKQEQASLLKQLEQQELEIRNEMSIRETARQKELSDTKSDKELTEFNQVMQEMLDQVDVQETEDGFFVTGKTQDVDFKKEQQPVENEVNEKTFKSLDLSTVIQGGVAAQNKAAAEAKRREEQEHLMKMVEIKKRADQKDQAIARDASEDRQQPKKLGPSSIRTLIRAADSRQN